MTYTVVAEDGASANQTVTVSGVDDDLVDGDQKYSIALSIGSGSTTDTTGYSSLDPSQY